jgi:hypothetical protein
LFQLHHGTKTVAATVKFKSPHPRSAATLEREDFVEKGAIVLAGLLLTHFEGKQITRIVPRGGRIDYFVGERPGDFRWILEVSGTDVGSLEARRQKKRAQLLESFLHRPPCSRDGYVSVTRFGPRAASTLDAVPAER